MNDFYANDKEILSYLVLDNGVKVSPEDGVLGGDFMGEGKPVRFIDPKVDGVYRNGVTFRAKVKGGKLFYVVEYPVPRTRTTSQRPRSRRMRFGRDKT